MRRFCIPLFSIALLASGLTTCQPAQSPPLQERQQANIQVVKQLQRCLNQQDWPGAAQLYARRVRCKGPATHFKEVIQTSAQVVGAYQYLQPGELYLAGSSPIRPRPTPAYFEITQLYPAYENHVVAEGRLIDDRLQLTAARADPARVQRPICLIYTIENGKITRQYLY